MFWVRGGGVTKVHKYGNFGNLNLDLSPKKSDYFMFEATLFHWWLRTEETHEVKHFHDESWFCHTFFFRKDRDTMMLERHKTVTIFDWTIFDRKQVNIWNIEMRQFFFFLNFAFWIFSFKFPTPARFLESDCKAWKQSFPLSNIQDRLFNQDSCLFVIFFLWLFDCCNTFSNIFARVVQLALCLITKFLSQLFTWALSFAFTTNSEDAAT